MCRAWGRRNNNAGGPSVASVRGITPRAGSVRETLSGRPALQLVTDFGVRVQQVSDVPRERARLLRGTRHRSERRLEAGRAQSKEVQLHLLEHQDGALELAGHMPATV